MPFEIVCFDDGKLGPGKETGFMIGPKRYKFNLHPFQIAF